MRTNQGKQARDLFNAQGQSACRNQYSRGSHNQTIWEEKNSMVRIYPQEKHNMEPKTKCQKIYYHWQLIKHLRSGIEHGCYFWVTEPIWTSGSELIISYSEQHHKWTKIRFMIISLSDLQLQATTEVTQWKNQTNSVRFKLYSSIRKLMQL